MILQPSGFSADSRPLYGGTGEPEEGEECVAPWEADRLIPGNEEPGTSNRSRASVADPVAPASDTATAKASRFKLTPHGMQMVEAESEQTEKNTPGKPVENAYKLPPLSLLKNVKKQINDNSMLTYGNSAKCWKKHWRIFVSTPESSG